MSDRSSFNENSLIGTQKNGTLTNVLFTIEDLLEVFLNLMTVSPYSAKLIHSLHFTYDAKLTIKGNEVLASSPSDWKSSLTDKIDSIEKLDFLDESELNALKKAVRCHLEEDQFRVEKDSVIPNVLLVTPNPSEEDQKATLLYNNFSKKKYKFTLDHFARLNSILPNLKAIKSENINFKVERYDSIGEERNQVESVDIFLGNHVTSPTTLLDSIISSYHHTIKNIKLVTGENKDKWLPFEGEEEDLGIISNFKLNGFMLKHLESVTINFFGYTINTDRLMDELIETECKLKSLTLLGCVYGRSVLYTVTNYLYDCLESLQLSTEFYFDLSELKRMKKLKHFSFIWEKLEEEKVDILKVLMMVPNITSLEIGHSRTLGDLVNNVYNSDTYSNLTTLSLTKLNMEGDELFKIENQLPNLKELYLSNCKLGKSRTENETIFNLKNYNLEKLVVENCSLYYSKKEKNKRPISEFKFDIITQEPYFFGLNGGIPKRQTVGEPFGYVVDEKTTLCLRIVITSMKLFSANRAMNEYVSVIPESEIKEEDLIESESSAEEGDLEEEEDVDVDKSESEEVNESEEKDGNLIEVESSAEEGDSEKENEDPIGLESSAEEDGNLDNDAIDSSEGEEVEDEEEQVENNIEVDNEANNTEEEDNEEEIVSKEIIVDADDFGYDIDDNAVYSSDERNILYSGDEENENLPSNDEQDNSLNNSDSDNDDILIITPKMLHQKEKKQTFSDLDYNSSDEESDNSSTDSEYSVERGVRRSTRHLKLITSKSLRKRKRTVSNYYSSSRYHGYEDSEDQGDDSIDEEMVTNFVENVRKYRAVVKVKVKPTDFNFERSPSL